MRLQGSVILTDSLGKKAAFTGADPTQPDPLLIQTQGFHNRSQKSNPPASLEVSGLVESPLKWSWQGFMDQPQETFISDIHCVTQWSRYDNRWDGVSAAHILDLVRPKPEAQFIVFHSFDGYTTNIKRSVFEEQDVLLAHSWEGKPLTREHGAPVRVLIPGWYLWKSAKWIRKIEFVAEDERGFWEVRGYHNSGDPWKEERYSSSEAPEETFPVPDFEEE